MTHAGEWHDCYGDGEPERSGDHDAAEYRSLAEEFVGGTVGGVALAFGLNAIQAELSLPLPRFPGCVAVSLPFGAMLGDVGGSFLKRRTGGERGAPSPVVDQLWFVGGALGLSVLVAPEWTTTTVTPSVFVVVFVATPLLHLGTNGVAYVFGLKEEPW